MTESRRVLLMILDGWGHGPDVPELANAVAAARTPTHDRLRAERPHVLLRCSGGDVGLPDGQMGNSEVGHLNLGAGRVVQQDITRIDASIESGELGEIEALRGLLSRTAAAGGALHLIGLVSDGGVHSHVSHLHALLEVACESAVERVLIHVITDGRDTSPNAGAGFIADLESWCKRRCAEIATVTGRYYAMDRDNRWERTERAYRLIVEGDPPPGVVFGVAGGECASASSMSKRPNQLYSDGVTDEFIEPTLWGDGGRRGVRTGDGVLFFNFRSDRMRQFLRAMTEPAAEFDGFSREPPRTAGCVTMTQYAPHFPVDVLFEPRARANVLAEFIAAQGCRQFKIAETEKYAHVTYFFNGGAEPPCDGEDRAMVPSPKVATYDLAPRMSCEGVTDRLMVALEDLEHLENANGDAYRFLLVNYANPDMVGHTGDFDAAVAAVEATDESLARVLACCERNDVVALVTADHGNAEQMLDAAGGPHTAHTTNPVDFLLVDPRRSWTLDAHRCNDYRLADVAPTVLRIMGFEPPAEMDGRSIAVLVRRDPDA